MKLIDELLKGRDELESKIAELLITFEKKHSIGIITTLKIERDSAHYSDEEICRVNIKLEL